MYIPLSSGLADNIFITRSYDATPHFETVVEDVQDVWKQMIGSDTMHQKCQVGSDLKIPNSEYYALPGVDLLEIKLAVESRVDPPLRITYLNRRRNNYFKIRPVKK